MKLIGIDPGIANCGWAVMDIGEGPETTAIGVWSTSPSGRLKAGIGASDDNVRRARYIGDELSRLIQEHKPVALCCESMSYPPSPKGAHMLGICWGVIVTVAETYHLAIVQVSPQDIKRSLCGRRDASKTDVENALLQIYHPRMAMSVTSSKREHAFDALGAIHSARETEYLRLVIGKARCQ